MISSPYQDIVDQLSHSEADERAYVVLAGLASAVAEREVALDGFQSRRRIVIEHHNRLGRFDSEYVHLL